MTRRAEACELFAGARYIDCAAQQRFVDGQIVMLRGLRYRIVHQHPEQHRIYDAEDTYRWFTHLRFWAELNEPGLTDAQRRRILGLVKTGHEEAAQAAELVRALQLESVPVFA